MSMRHFTARLIRIGNTAFLAPKRLTEALSHHRAWSRWPGSHARIWDEQWAALEQRGELHTHSRRGLTTPSEWFGQFKQILRDTPAVETHAPAGSVVLWHTKILHMRGHNTKKADPMQDSIRQGTIYSFVKASHALPDAQQMTREGGGMWRDWSAEVQGVLEKEEQEPETATTHVGSKL